MSVRRLSRPKLSVHVSEYVGLVAALVAVWGVGDALSTLWAIEATGSIGGEANPWIRAVLAHDPALLLVVKTAVVAVVGGLLLSQREFVQSVPGWRLWFGSLLAVGSIIVAGNVSVGLAAVL
ncbi:putative membrane protein [Halapricum desulfuricans]|uniref:Putative membrane protein n=1 Tax=Halapricum desulfuricans TaxID=2841257 RepID=A0A897NEQ5_9EURY|nr:DUF5658 family protein [Halapricum desulfuricans]QSG11162.1 putative membrane protein [Halapricum desulfuricans]